MARDELCRGRAVVVLGGCLGGLILCGIAFNRMLTVHAQTERKLFRLAYYDWLTELPNRALLMKNLNTAISAAKKMDRSVAVLYLDIDNFKNINDSLSYDVGDHLLQLFAKRLDGIVNAEKILSRLGGDEFVVVLPNVTQINEVTGIVKMYLMAWSNHLLCRAIRFSLR